MRKFCVLMIALATVTASTEMIGPNRLPADRVLKNLKARLAKNPKDAEVEYMLGRTYYALFCADDPRTIQLYGTAESARFPSMHTNVWEFKDLKPRGDQESVANIRASISHLQSAIALGGGEPGLYQLTLACAFEASAPIATKVDPKASESRFRDKALSCYEQSYLASRRGDEKRPFPQMAGSYEKWISMEASDSILRLDPKNALKSDIEAHVKVMRSLPPGPITPIVFSLSASRGLEDLLDHDRVVQFDLDGTGARQRYSWVKAETAILVWQPNPRVPIRNGRQLLGSASWWIMPKDGYSAMALLDDNADGWLTGRELNGLAIWRDRNQNGIAEPTEVVPIARTAIAGLRTRATGRIGPSLVSTGGLRLASGEVLPTYDWVTRAVQ